MIACIREPNSDLLGQILISINKFWGEQFFVNLINHLETAIKETNDGDKILELVKHLHIDITGNQLLS